MMTKAVERVPFNLPRKDAHAPHCHQVFIKQIATLCIVLLKKKIIDSLKGNSQAEMDNIEAFLLQVWNHGYNKGLKDMDKMHGTLDNRK